jgi:hypothetical protein|tara:strand:- start:5165 stop:5302 length:138 start_codon:yes stop_codon:yes gene_type:complete
MDAGAVEIQFRVSRKWRLFENRSGAYFWDVSTGSAENRHLQAAIT